MSPTLSLTRLKSVSLSDDKNRVHFIVYLMYPFSGGFRGV
jgi:hypothetical protein